MASAWSLLALLAAAAVAVHGAPLLGVYQGHRVLRLQVLPTQLQCLRTLERDISLDWWQELPTATGVEVTADVRVPPAAMPSVLSVLKSCGAAYTVMIDDIERAIQHQLVAAPPTGDQGADWFTEYHDYPATVDWIKSLVAQYPGLATLETVGTSFEGRAIYAVKISANTTANKPVVFYDGGIHAREWISPAAVQFVMYSLLSGYAKDASIKALVDGIEWHIVPIFNVDGFQFTHQGQRLWRKTRMPNKGSSCIGTDPCRNSATGFGGPGSSGNPCADDYRGVKAFDQPETAAVSAFIAKLRNVRGYINFHSYSQLWMSPYGYTTTLPPAADLAKQTEVGKAAVAAIKATHGLTYEEGPVATTIYMASGVISDWVYATLNVTLSYAVELRDTGAYGFLLPPTQIIPCGEEILAAAKVMGNYIIKNP